MEKLGISEAVIKNELLRFTTIVKDWNLLISQSFLSLSMQKKHQELIAGRIERMLW